jgi:hypothetical protein
VGRLGSPGQADRASDARGTKHGWSVSTDQRLEPESLSTSLPTWLVKELRRAGVSDQSIEGLDEERARDLITEIRQDAVE